MDKRRSHTSRVLAWWGYIIISKYVTCAEPDKNVSPTLYQRVTSYQTHKHNNYACAERKQEEVS